jgi:hypothetical protein
VLRRSHAPLELARDHGRLCLLARERLECPHLFLRPRTAPRYLLRHLRSPCTNVTNESATIIIQKRLRPRIRLRDGNFRSERAAVAAGKVAFREFLVALAREQNP